MDMTMVGLTHDRMVTSSTRHVIEFTFALAAILLAHRAGVSHLLVEVHVLT